jgi:hypothetical protein
MLALTLTSLLLHSALAQAPRVPSRQVPPAVLVELQLLENRFDLALAVDCDASRCFTKGCAYIDHAVADQPRSASMPGLGQELGPGSVAAQEYLTKASCSFTHEQSLAARDVQALVRRLQAKLSSGWTVVTVDSAPLEPLPAYLREPIEEEEPEPETVEEPDPVEEPVASAPWSETAGRELWAALLPHFFWMIGLLLVTIVGTILLWAWRRVGVVSAEEQALLAQMLGPEDGDAPPDPQAEALARDTESDAGFVEAQAAAWQARLEAMDPEDPDPEIVGLLRQLLRAGDIPLLAKAVMRFPEHLPAAFPHGGDVATAKRELASFLETADAAELPSDIALFEALERHALSATLLAQRDARVVQSLHDDFGAAGLVEQMRRLSPRMAGLLFALAPLEEQHEMTRLLSAGEIAQTASWLLRSTRMDPDETAHLFSVLAGSSHAGARPAMVETPDVSDRGATFDAAGALSVLLPKLHPTQRAELFAQALRRFGGTPSWYRGILVADMLLVLPAEARTDLLLELDLQPLAAWLMLQDSALRAELLAGIPDSLRVALDSVAQLPSRAHQLELAVRGRRELTRGFQRQLLRARIPFERVLVPQDAASA